LLRYLSVAQTIDGDTVYRDTMYPQLD